MIINSANLALLYEGFNTSFNNGLGEAKSNWQSVAMEMPSSTRTTLYAWLAQLPSVRQWLGDRQIQNVSAHTYSIENKDFELTISVPRNDILDDQYGLFAPLFQDMGRACAVHPDQLVFGLLANGFTTLCYDGANFFDTAHPLYDVNGLVVGEVANVNPGAGPAWYLVDTSRAVKPLIYQMRQPYQMVAAVAPEDPNVFNRKEFLYGVDARSNVGFGFWQMAYASQNALTADSYAAARAAMQALTGESGRPLGIKPDTMIVPPELEEAALQILNADRNAAGASNVWAHTANLVVTP